MKNTILKQFLKGKDREEFAKKIGTTKNYLNLLVVEARKPSPDLAMKIEIASGGEVKRDMLLFPYLYQKLDILESQIDNEYSGDVSRKLDAIKKIIEG